MLGKSTDEGEKRGRLERRSSQRGKKEEDFIYIIPESPNSVDLHPCKED